MKRARHPDVSIQSPATITVGMRVTALASHLRRSKWLIKEVSEHLGHSGKVTKDRDANLEIDAKVANARATESERKRRANRAAFLWPRNALTDLIQRPTGGTGSPSAPQNKNFASRLALKSGFAHNAPKPR